MMERGTKVNEESENAMDGWKIMDK